MKRFLALTLSASSLFIINFPSLAQQVPSRQPTSGQGCQCPYDIDAVGRRCDERSVYSHSTGESPICYMEAAPQNAPVRIYPSESDYDRYMRIGYDASRNRDYQTALINFRRALVERPSSRAAIDAARRNMETAIAAQSR